MMHPIRRIKAAYFVHCFKRAAKRLPEEQQMALQKSWFSSRAQWTRIIGVAIAMATALGIDPLVAGLNKLAEAAAGGSLTEVLMAILGLLYFVSRFFDRSAEERRHTETHVALKPKE